MKSPLASVVAYWKKWNQVYRSQVFHGEEDQYLAEHVEATPLPVNDPLSSQQIPVILKDRGLVPLSHGSRSSARGS